MRILTVVSLSLMCSQLALASGESPTDEKEQRLRELNLLMNLAQPQVQSCGMMRKAGTGDLTGQFEVDIAVSEAGSVHSVTFVSDTVNDAQVRSCVESKLSQLTFPLGTAQSMRMPVNIFVPAGAFTPPDASDNVKRSLDMAVGQRTRALNKCFTKAQKRDDAKQGQLTLSLHIERAHIADANVLSNTTDSASLASCAIHLAQSLELSVTTSDYVAYQIDFLYVD